MILNLIPPEKLQQLGCLKFMAIFAPILALTFLGLIAIATFIFEGIFAMEYARMVQAASYGFFMALYAWFRIVKKHKSANP